MYTRPMIVVDSAVMWPGPLCKRLGPSCHCVSDVPGAAGTEELLAFAKRLGLRASWLQKPDTRHEHFDLFGKRRAAAVASGAREVTRNELVAIFKNKRVCEDGPSTARS